MVRSVCPADAHTRLYSKGICNICNRPRAMNMWLRRYPSKQYMRIGCNGIVQASMRLQVSQHSWIHYAEDVNQASPD